jgi:hypothetical protein
MLHVGLDEREPSTAFIEYAEGLCDKKTAESKQYTAYIYTSDRTTSAHNRTCMFL